MQTAAEREVLVASKLTTAADWKAKGEVRRELTCVGGAIESLLTIAVMHTESAEAGVAYLRGKHVAELLTRYCALNTALLEAFNLGAREAAVDNTEVFAHIAWLLDEHTLGDAILAIVRNVELGKLWPRTKFWAEYDRALSHLVARTPYVPNPPPKLKGYEKCWAPYLDLMAALTGGRDTAPALAACAASFARRNRDKRLTDWKQHDGDGRLPVRWDFRVPSLLGRWNARR
jgi:hypothetical protein